MPNEQVITYLKENKDQFPQETLKEQLKNAGHPEADILEGMALVYGQGTASVAPTTPVSFWNFKTPRTYRTASEKITDGFFGFFVPLFTLFVPFGPLIVDVFFLVYFWNRRRCIAYGVLWRLGSEVVLGVVLFVFFFTSFYRWM